MKGEEGHEDGMSRYRVSYAHRGPLPLPLHKGSGASLHLSMEEGGQGERVLEEGRRKEGRKDRPVQTHSILE